MLQAIDKEIDKLSQANFLDDVNKESIHEWKNNPVTKAWFLEALKLYSHNVSIMADGTPTDNMTMARHAQCVGENHILEQFLDIKFIDEEET